MIREQREKNTPTHSGGQLYIRVCLYLWMCYDASCKSVMRTNKSHFLLVSPRKKVDHIITYSRLVVDGYLVGLKINCM